MPPSRSPAQQTAARANGARSHGPTTDAGKARAARNGTRHGLRGGPFALLPGEDREAFAALHAAVTSDWGPRDPYERRWVMELVAAMWRQDRLRGLEIATLTAAAAESPPSEATMRRLATFARYGARIDKDIGRALQALRTLRNRPDAWLDALPNDTPEPDARAAQERDGTSALPPCTPDPESAAPPVTDIVAARAACTPEPGPAMPAPALNRHQRRRLEALARRAGQRAA